MLLQAVNAVYHVNTIQRAKDIKEMLEQDKIYQKRTANNLVSGESVSILTKISKKWKRKGRQQDNNVRMMLCQAFLATYTNAEIALEIRRYSFRSVHFYESSRYKVRV
jgi:hypothetical protein